MEPAPLMEGRLVCCGKLPHAGHAHDCPERPAVNLPTCPHCGLRVEGPRCRCKGWMSDEEVYLAVLEADLCRLSREGSGTLDTAEGRKRVASALVAKGWKWGAK